MQSPIKQQINQQSQNESSEASLAIINIVNNQITNSKSKSHQDHQSQIYADEKENMASFGNLQIFQNTFENVVNDLEYPDKKDQYEPSLPFCDFQSFNYTGSSQFDMQTTPCLKSAAGTLPQTSRRDTGSKKNRDIQQCLISNEKKRFSDTGLSNVSEISRKSSKQKSRSIHNSRSLSRKSRDLYKDQISKIMKGNRNTSLIKAPTQKMNSQNSKNHEGSTFVSMSNDNSFHQFNEFGTLNESQYKNNDLYFQENIRTTTGDCSITDDGTNSNIRSYIIHDSDRLNTQAKLKLSQKSISESVDVLNNQINSDIHQIQEHNNIISQKENELRQLREQMDIQMKKNMNARNYIDQMFENNILMPSQRQNSFQNADDQFYQNDVKKINYRHINLASDSELEDFNSDKISRDVLQMPRQIDKPFLEYSDPRDQLAGTNKFNQTHLVNQNLNNKQTLRNQQSLQEFQSQYSEHYNYPQHQQSNNHQQDEFDKQQNMNLHKNFNQDTQQLRLINQNSELDDRQFSQTQNIQQIPVNCEQYSNHQRNIKILDQMKKSAKNNRTKACNSVSNQPLNMKIYRPKIQKAGNSVSSKNKNLRQSIAKVDSGLEKIVGRRGRQERQKPSSKTRIDFDKKNFQQLRSPSSKERKSSKDSISKTRLQQKLKLLKEGTSQQRSVKQPSKKIEMMKSFGNKSDQNQKQLDATRQFGSSTNTRWQGFSEKFSPDILNEEIENQLIGKIDNQAIMKIPYNQIEQTINSKIQNSTLSDSMHHNYGKKNLKQNLNKDLNMDETFKTQESFEKDKEMTFIQFLKHIQIYIQQEQQNQDIDQTNDSQKCLFRNLEYLKSKYNTYLNLQRSKINQQTLQTMHQVHSPKIQKSQKNGSSSVMLNADLRSDQFPVLQTTISQDLRLMMNTNQSENTLDETFKRKINKNRNLDSSFRNDLQHSPSDIIKNQETVEDHSFRANPPISFSHANDKNYYYTFFKQQCPSINNQQAITTRRDSLDNQKIIHDQQFQQQHQADSNMQIIDQKQKTSFMKSIGHLKPRGSFALPPRDNKFQQSQALSTEVSQKHKQQIKYIEDIYKKVVLDNKKGLKKSRDTEKIKMDQLKQQAQEAVQKFQQFEDTKKQIRSFSQTMQNNQNTNQSQFVTFNKKSQNTKNQSNSRQHTDKNIMQQSQGIVSYSYPKAVNKDIEPILYSDFYQNQEIQQYNQYQNYNQNENNMRMQKTSSQDLEDHINEIKKLKEDLILPPRMNRRTNSNDNQMNDFQNTIGAKNSSIESQPLLNHDARYPSIAVSSSQQTELLNQVQILQQLIVDPKNMSMSQIKETLFSLNQTAQELSKACQGIQEYANQLQKKHIMYHQNDQKNQTANFQINDVSSGKTSDKQGIFSKIKLNENSPLVNVTSFQERSGAYKDSKQEITFFTSSRDNLQSNQNLNSHITIDSHQQKEQQKIDIQNQQNTFSAPFIQTQHTSFINTSENDNMFSSYSHSYKHNDHLKQKKQTEQRLITFSKNDGHSSGQHTHHVSSSKYDYQNTNTFPSQASYFLTSDQEMDLKCTQNLPKEMLIKDQSEKEEMVERIQQNIHQGPYLQQRFVVNQNQSSDSMALTTSQEELVESTQRVRNVQKSSQHAKLFLIQDDSRSLVSQQMADFKSFSQSPNYTLGNYKDKNEQHQQDGQKEELKLNFNYENIQIEQLLHKMKKDELTSLKNLQDDSIHSSWIQNIQLNQHVQSDYLHKNQSQIQNYKPLLKYNDDLYNQREKVDQQQNSQLTEREKFNNNQIQANQLERQLNYIIQENPYDKAQNQRPPSSIYSERPPSYIHADRTPSNTFIETSQSLIYGEKPQSYFNQEKPPKADQLNDVQKFQGSQYRKVDEFATFRTFEGNKIEKEKQKSILHYSQYPKSSFTQNPSKELLDFNSSSFISKTDAYLSQINHQQSYQNIIPSQEDENRQYSGSVADRLINNNHITTPESSNYKIIKENLLKHEVTLTPEEFEQYIQANMIKTDDIFGQNELVSQRIYSSSRQSYADVYDQYRNHYMQTQSSKRGKIYDYQIENSYKGDKHLNHKNQ